jgi:GNAT superfamily N-acetyltransferase
MEKIIIRKAEISDLPYLYELCIKTGYQGKDASELFYDPFTMGNYYVAPYLSYPHGINFIAEYNYRPQGYIVAVPDTNSFNQWMEDNWLPVLRSRYSILFSSYNSDYEKEIIEKINAKHFPLDQTLQAQYSYSDYPSELHINLHPRIHRKGIGCSLINRVFLELEQQNVSGVNIGVGMDNNAAINFFNKMGFTVLTKECWGYTMGKLLK